MDALVEADPVSLTATLEPGCTGPRVEELLAAEGLTLGHFPQSWEYATLGGFVATRSAGRASTGYGRIDELVLGLRAATPVGTVDLPPLPASAAGPDLRGLLVGSEGTLGVITQATLAVRPQPRRQAERGLGLRLVAGGLRRVPRDGAGAATPPTCAACRTRPRPP